MERQKCGILFSTALVVAILAPRTPLLAEPADAFPKTAIGTWIGKDADCSRALTEDQLIIRDREYGNQESNCNISQLSKSENVYSFKSSCEFGDDRYQEEGYLISQGNDLVFHLKNGTSGTASIYKRCSSVAVPAPVEDGPLHQFRGTWAHSVEDCKAFNRGSIDAMPRSEASNYEIIEICKDAIEWRYSAASCGISNITSGEDGISFAASCEFKGELADRRVFSQLSVMGPNSIAFPDRKFWLFGKYVRCNTTPDCLSEQSNLDDNAPSELARPLQQH